MALTGYFCCGAECQIVTAGGPNPDDGHWDIINTPLAIDSAVFDPDGGGSSYKFASGVAGSLNKGFTPLPTKIAIHFRARVDNNNAAPNGYGPVEVVSSAGSNLVVGWDTTGGFYLQYGAIVYNPDGLSANNTWHTVDVTADVSANPFVAKCKINGGTEFSATSAVAASTLTQVLFGNPFGLTQIGNLWIDNMVITTSAADYPIARTGISLYKVNTVSGTHNTPADFNDQNSVALVNGDNTGANLQELPADTTTFTGQVTAGAGAYAEYVYNTAAETRIPLMVEQAVSVLANNVTGANQQALLSDGVGTRAIEGLVTINTTTIKTQSKNHSTPPSGGSWTAALFQALRLRWGFSTTAGANQARVSNTFLEAAFPATVVSSASAGASSFPAWHRRARR